MYCSLICTSCWKLPIQGLGRNIHRPAVNNRRIAKLSMSKVVEKACDHIVNVDVRSKPRLDAYLSTIFKDFSRSFFGNLCEKGKVEVNKIKQSKSYKVLSGDHISFMIEMQGISTIEAENIPLDIIHEDDDIIAINKANGMVVHPAVGSPNGTFVNALLFHLGEKKAAELIKGNEEVLNMHSEDEFFDLPETPEAASAVPWTLRPGIVHRLDKGTTGVLIAGKHPVAVERLSSIFAHREIEKTYIAICVGHPGDTTISKHIGRSLKNRQMMTIYNGAPGKLAVSHTKTIGFDGKLSVVLVRIETGR